jgi:hypothetical protein
MEYCRIILRPPYPITSESKKVITSQPIINGTVRLKPNLPPYEANMTFMGPMLKTNGNIILNHKTNPSVLITLPQKNILPTFTHEFISQEENI